MRFPLKPRQAIRIGGEQLGQNLQGDVAIQLRIARAIDLAHPAGTQRSLDFVRTEASSGGQSHGGARAVRAVEFY
jgi:hypothetical protein